MISVVILTLNEEQDLAGCLGSVAWCDDVHVLDSFSSDDTVGVARAAGAAVVQRRFDNYAAQRNAGLALPGLQHEWVLFLDADERVPAELVRTMFEAVRSAADEIGAFRLRRRDYFMGRWLKHAQISPFYVRLLRRGRAHHERTVNEVVCVRGRIEDLPGHFVHFPFSKGLGHWLDKHNRYSGLEAQLALMARRGQSRFSIARAFFACDFSERRFHQKELFYRLPARPVLKLIYMLFVRGALLDGRAGITYAFLQSVYEWFIVLKTDELGRAPAVDAPPEAFSELRASEREPAYPAWTRPSPPSQRELCAVSTELDSNSLPPR